MHSCKKNLKIQDEQLNTVDPMFKEMEFSLKRAGKKVKNMMIKLSKDKIIICLIVIICIIILSIIIVSLSGGDKTNNYNLPFDIFQSNNKNKNLTTYESSLCLFNKYYYTIIFLLLLIL